VVASRFAKGGHMEGGPKLKSLIVRTASFLLHWLGRLPATDATYGLRLFSRRVIEEVAVESTEGFTYAIEIVAKCHRLGWGIAEVPAQWYRREKGESRFNLKKWLPHYLRWYWYVFATTYLRKGPETVRMKNGVKQADEAASRVVERCQICGNEHLESVLFLGYLPPVNDFKDIGERPTEEPSYPAEVVYCPRCHLVQSGYIVDPKIVFPASYPYTSSTTKLLRDNFAELYREYTSLFKLGTDDLVVDIGSNDGNLLSNFKDHHRVLGITPEDIGKLAIERGIPTILDYFTKDIAERVEREYGRPKLITSTNAFAHIDNVNEITDLIYNLLADDGIFVIEVHYLKAVVELNQFDTIYHEHLRHYSLHSIKYLLEHHGFEVIHARNIPSHAGSIRVYAARKGIYPVKDSVAQMLAAEKSVVTDMKSLHIFRDRATQAKLQLMALLNGIKERGECVYGIGAPSRGTTLIHYVGIDENVVDCTLEIKGSHKMNKYVPGTLIPVLDETKLFEDQPEYVLLFSWQITDELIPKLKEKGYRGKFIVPLPEPQVRS